MSAKGKSFMEITPTIKKVISGHWYTTNATYRHAQCISNKIFTRFCCACYRFGYRLLMVHKICWPIFFSVASSAMGQSYDWHYSDQCQRRILDGCIWYCKLDGEPGPSFIKPDQLDPRIKDQLRNALLSTILSLQLPNFVSCGRACPSHMTQNLVTVGAKLWTGEWFSFDPWSLDQADLVW